MGAHACAIAWHELGEAKACGIRIGSSVTKWVPGMEHRWTLSAVSAFTHWASISPHRWQSTTHGPQQCLPGSLISFSCDFRDQPNTFCLYRAMSIKPLSLPASLCSRGPQEPCRRQCCLLHQWLAGPLFKTNSESNKAFPLCKCNVVNKPGNMWRCQIWSRHPWWLQPVLSFCLQFDFLWHRKTNYFSKQCSSLARVRSSYLDKDLPTGQAACPGSSARVETLIFEDGHKVRTIGFW